VFYLTQAEKWGTPPWELLDAPNGPSREWWLHKASILAEGERLARERMEARAKRRT